MSKHTVFANICLAATIIQALHSSSNMTCSKPCKIFLRHDQRAKDVGAHKNSNISIYAPSWVQEGLEKLTIQLSGTNFGVYEPTSIATINKPLQVFSIDGSKKMTLSELQKISRNEEWNVSGIINWALYSEGGINDTKILLAMKDLVRQSIIVGRDISTFYGGYGTTRKKLDNITPVYICDLAALQFQKQYNTGRLVLLYQNDPPPDTIGLLDDFIFERVVGEKRKSYQEAIQSDDPDNKRYISTRGFRNRSCLFDVVAYRKFISGDVTLVGLAFSELASKHENEAVVLKFLKYGTGFFAGEFVSETSNNILGGVLDGLEILFEKYGVSNRVLKHIEFPFYRIDSTSKARLEAIKIKYNVSYSFSSDDALKPTQRGLIVATTNCGDSMAVIGNEMGFSSVDAAIAENLQTKGFTFCPILNPEMQERFMDLT